MSAAPSGRLLGDGFTLCLAIFDDSRGNREDDEADKVLAFYPATARPADQAGVVGLAQALAKFTDTFEQARKQPQAKCI